MSRLQLARPAVRPQMPARILVAGPAGAGPLMVALDLADRLAVRTVVVDAADGASLDLADLHSFDVVRWSPPYRTPELVELLGEVGEGTVVVIDHLSAWWSGVGGLRDIGHGGDWQQARGLMSNLVRAILGCRGHVIATSRTRLRTTIDVVEGREHTRLVAEGPTLDDVLIYPWPVLVRTSSGLDLTVEATRVPPVQLGPTTTEDLATAYQEWLLAGEPVVDLADAGVLVGAMDLDNPQARKRIKGEFAASFGDPKHLPASQLEAAQAFIDRHVRGAA